MFTLETSLNPIVFARYFQFCSRAEMQSDVVGDIKIGGAAAVATVIKAIP